MDEIRAYRVLTRAEQKERADIIRSGSVYKDYGTDNFAGFDKMDVATAIKLMKLNYAIASDSQNGAPTFNEMVQFCEKHPGFTLHGYVVGGDREDARVMAEGVQGTAKDFDALLDFIAMFGRASEFKYNRESLECYCWYD